MVGVGGQGRLVSRVGSKQRAEAEGGGVVEVVRGRRSVDVVGEVEVEVEVVKGRRSVDVGEVDSDGEVVLVVVDKDTVEEVVVDGVLVVVSAEEIVVDGYGISIISLSVDARGSSDCEGKL